MTLRGCAAVVLLAAGAAGCSPATMGMNRMADALSRTASAYARDDDPEFVRAGAPATLKMVEMMLDGQSRHAGLLLTACSGFTQYAYAFLHLDSEAARLTNAPGARELRERAIGMYGRAHGYCLRLLAESRPRLREALESDPRAALTLLDSTTIADVPALYWTAVAWAGELSLDPPLGRLPELALVRGLLTRALALDEDWEGGAIHEALMSVEGLPRLLGGSTERARTHFDRAVALSEGHSAMTYLTAATSIALPAGDRAEFERLLKRALAVDLARRPDLRLANTLARRHAQVLLARADQLFTK